MAKRVLFPAFLLLVVCAAPRPLAAAPRLLFTDLESGPVTGGQDGLGVFLSIYGEGFGPVQGTSTVTIGGQPVARVVTWGENNAPGRGLDLIVVQPGPGVASGSIVVTVAGQASNTLPFTARAGSIYFVNAATGSDANPGTHAQPWATLWRPRQTMAAGDVVYFEGGTYTQLDPAVPGWDTMLFLDGSMAATGTAAAPVAYLGYPGNPPLVQNASARRGVYFNQDAGAISYYILGNFRFTLTPGPVIVNGIGHRLVGNDFYDGIEGAVEIFGNTSAIKVLGNRMVGNGLPTNKFYTIYVQGFGTNSDVEIGWNEMREQDGGRFIQVFGHTPGDRVEDLRIHDNVLSGCELNAIVMGGTDGGTEILGTVRFTGNVVTGARAEGVRVNDPQGTVIIESNTIVGNAVAQVYLQTAGAGRITLRDNVIVAAAGQAYYQLDAGASPASFVPANNLVWGAGGCEAWDAGCVHQDPLFVSATDFHLQAGSPAIDAGVATSATRDHDGIPRPQGSAFDVGAFEWATPGPPPSPTHFYTVVPCRVCDTRNSSGPDAGAPPLAAGESRLVPLSGRCGIPASARSLSVNMAVTGAAAPGYLTLYPADAAPPTVASLNFAAGATRANNAVLSLASGGGGLRVMNGSAGSVDFILDVNGWFE